MITTFYKWLANILPRELVYYCTIRLMVHGTTGRYSHTNINSVRAITLVARWDKQWKVK